MCYCSVSSVNGTQIQIRQRVERNNDGNRNKKTTLFGAVLYTLLDRNNDCGVRINEFSSC